MVSKILVSAALAVGAAVAVAAPAGADPSVFSTLSCSCAETVSDGKAPAADQVKQGLRAGLSDLPAGQPPQ